MFLLLEASLVSFLPSPLAGCLTGWWHRKAEEPSELSSWTGQAAPAPQLHSVGRPRPLRTCFPTSKCTSKFLFISEILSGKFCFLGTHYLFWLFGCLFGLLDIRLREDSILALPKSSFWLGSFLVYWCAETILIKQKSKKCLLDRWEGKENISAVL